MRLSKNFKLFLYAASLLIVLFAIYIHTYREGYSNLYDEHNKKLDLDTWEKEEQDDARKYILPTDCVLELGARYGTVSVVINKKLKDPSLHVVVEPDNDVWGALEKNKQNSNSKFHIIKGLLSNKKFSLEKGGVKTRQVEDKDSTMPHFSFDEVKKLVNKPFTALVADCEGCVEHFLTENIEILDNLRIVLLEEDEPDKCDYSVVKQLFNQYSLKEVKSGFRSVWIRQ
jgi:hypothetical protein